jgi:hypothetical protein
MGGVALNFVREDALHPGFVSGGFYHAVPGVLPSTTVMTLTQNIIYAQPMILHRSARVNGITSNVTTGAVGAARFGIYRSAGALPSTLVAETAELASTNAIATNHQTFSTPPTLTAGLYWIAVVTSGTPSLTRFGGSPNAFGGYSFWISGTSAAALYSTASGRTGGYQVAHAYAALPASFGTAVDTVNTPLMGWSHV